MSGHNAALAHHLVREVSFRRFYVLCRCGERLPAIVPVGPQRILGGDIDRNADELADYFRRHRTDVHLASRREARP